MTRLLVHLAFAGIRARVLGSVLTIVIAGAAATTIVLALEVRSTGADPWQRTFDAAHGAHVLATVPSEADAERVAGLPGVAEAGAPTPNALSTLGHGDRTERLQLVGLDETPTVNAPVRTDGSALHDGGVVLERSLARARRARRRLDGARGWRRAARRRAGHRAQPAALPAQQPGRRLGHAPDVRADRHRPRDVALAGGRAARRSRWRRRVRRSRECDVRARRARLGARRLRDLAAAARGGAARRRAGAAGRDRLRRAAAGRRVRGGRHPGGRAGRRPAARRRAAQGGGLHAAPDRAGLRPGVGRARGDRLRRRLRGRRAAGASARGGQRGHAPGAAACRGEPVARGRRRGDRRARAPARRAGRRAPQRPRDRRRGPASGRRLPAPLPRRARPRRARSPCPTRWG